MSKKIISSLSLVLTILLLFNSTATAATYGTMASNYISAYSAYVNSDGDGKVSVWFEVYGTKIMDEIGVSKIELQEKESGSSVWKTVKTYSNLLTYNDIYYASSVDYSGKAGNAYRAYVTVWAGKNGDGDSRTTLTYSIIA